MKELVLTNQQETVKLAVAQINYVTTTATPHQVRIDTLKRAYFVYEPLWWFENASPLLIRCSRSCVVNLQQISAIEKNTRRIQFISTETLAVICSRQLYKKVRDAWLNVE